MLIPFYLCGILTQDLCDLPLHDPSSTPCRVSGGGFYFPGNTGVLYPQIGKTSMTFLLCALRRLILSNSVTRRPIRLAVIG